MKRKTAFLVLSTPLFLGLGLPAAAEKEAEKKSTKTKAAHAEHLRLIAVLTPASGSKVSGTVAFEPLEDNTVKITARLEGFEPGSAHGFHIHQFGDLSSKEGRTAGGHFNPKGHAHGLPPAERRHAGDLGTITADENGHVSHSLTVDNLRLTGKQAILGRAVIVHAKPDSGKGESGDAGHRIAQGVIGYRFQPDEKEG